MHAIKCAIKLTVRSKLTKLIISLWNSVKFNNFTILPTTFYNLTKPTIQKTEKADKLSIT